MKAYGASERGFIGRLSNPSAILAAVLESGSARELMQDEASYICTSCGEEIVVPIDLSAGESQEYTEDCPVCCHPNLIRIEVSQNGDIQAWAETESE